jgi:hypothetical protein
VRFFLDFLKFGGGRGLRARGPYLHTHGAPYKTRTSRAVGALVTPWSSGKVATPCSRVALIRVVSQRSIAESSDGKSDLGQGR